MSHRLPKNMYVVKVNKTMFGINPILNDTPRSLIIGFSKHMDAKKCRNRIIKHYTKNGELPRMEYPISSYRNPNKQKKTYSLSKVCKENDINVEQYDKDYIVEECSKRNIGIIFMNNINFKDDSDFNFSCVGLQYLPDFEDYPMYQKSLEDDYHSST